MINNKFHENCYTMPSSRLWDLIEHVHVLTSNTELFVPHSLDQTILLNSDLLVPLVYCPTFWTDIFNLQSWCILINHTLSYNLRTLGFIHIFNPWLTNTIPYPCKWWTILVLSGQSPLPPIDIQHLDMHSLN